MDWNMCVDRNSILSAFSLLASNLRVPSGGLSLFCMLGHCKGQLIMLSVGDAGVLTAQLDV